MNQKLIRIRQILAVFVLLAAVAGISSCEKYSYTPPVVDPLTPLSFQADIQPIFTANCIGCHKGTRNPDLRISKSFASLTTGGYVNLPAETSKLNIQIISSSHASFTLPAEKGKIMIWIQQGALNN